MNNKSFYISATLLLISTLIILAIQTNSPPTVITTNLKNIPMEIMNYTGKESSFSLRVYEELNADEHVYRQY